LALRNLQTAPNKYLLCNTTFQSYYSHHTPFLALGSQFKQLKQKGETSMNIEATKDHYLCNFRCAGIVEIHTKETLLANYIDVDEKSYMHDFKPVSIKELLDRNLLEIDCLKVSENGEVTIKRIW
jgi:hypothetical protein